MPIKLLVLVLTLFVSLATYAQPAAWTTYTDSVKHAWGAPSSKLLTPEQQVDFKGVKYMPYDSTYCLAVEYVPIKNADTILVATTRKTTSRYLPWATVSFVLHDTPCALTVYRGLDPWSEMDLYFVMFNDLTNGDSSYGGGRYLELHHVDETGGTAILDFNFSYNPYCAYADRYSCPIPPKENRLEVEVNAGVGY
ncbi:MAG: DUF1684 domain-containing protein [Saprospiraceae bacterium]